VRRAITWVMVAFAAFATLAATEGCSRKKDDGTAPIADKALPPLSIKDDTPDLMLTWIDDKGNTHVELRPEDVPAAGRSLVRVVVSDREDGTHDLFYVVDLTKKEADGSYAAHAMRRRAWEEELEKRRAAYLAKVAPPPPPSTAPTGSPAERPEPGEGVAPTTGFTVIIYGASWCGPCHEAASYLKSKGVPYVMKDIEETPGAAGEMREKLTRTGQHGGSIPVIDVRGQILVGFSTTSIDRALAKARGGTAL
jgi:glutaredoxin